jgi:RHS repeat-associated protein
MRENKSPEDVRYRYGYQGQFAEKDEETGWNHFELREYDAVIGRWLVPDPARQHYSLYMGMGNNPVSGVDPDGAWVKDAGLWNNLFKTDSRIFAEITAASLKSDWTNYSAVKIGGEWGVLAEDKMLIQTNDWEAFQFKTFTPIDKDGFIGETTSLNSFVYSGPSLGTVNPDYTIESFIVGGHLFKGAAQGVSWLSKAGPTFSQYKAAYWATRAKPIYQPIRLSNGNVFKVTTELHHRFIPQRWGWAPNWLKNNSFNLQPLNTIQHGIRDSYRFRFFPTEIKNAINSGNTFGF